MQAHQLLQVNIVGISNSRKMLLKEEGINMADWKAQLEQAEVANLSGQHDLYLRWDGPASAFVVKNIQFRPADSYFVSAKDLESNSKMKAYPNPFENSVFIEGAEINSTYQIFTLDGRVAESGLLTQEQQRIGQNLKPGFYVLKAQNEVIKLNKSK